MSAPFKNVAVPLMLATFMFAAFFGFAAMSYGADGQMQGDCLFSVSGSLCSSSALPGVIHHLSAYQSFLNIPIGFGLLALIVALGLFSIALLLATRPPLIFSPSAPLGALYTSPPLVSHTRQLIRWLSLLEHSPSR